MVNLSGEYCRPYFIKNLGITETSQCCNPGVLIVRLGYAIGGVIALFVAMAGAKRARALDETAKAQEKGNVEERYKNAIEQFGKEDPSIRLAGAYGLYHLAKDNEDRRENICDVLCVHIRGITTSKKPILNNESYSEIYKDKPSDEVQSILNLLTKKDSPFKSHWINLENAYLNGANLDRAQLQGARLWNTQLQGATLKNAQLQRANLQQTQLQKTDLSEARLQEANLKEAQLKEAKLEEAHLQGASLWKVQLQGANLIQAQLQDANLNRAQLQGADLSSAQFQGANLSSAQFQGTDLRGAQLQGAYLYEAELQGADLEVAELRGTHLYRAQFQGANLIGAHLQGANLEYIQLQGTNLRYAELQGANLYEAQLQGANLEKAQLQGANLWRAQFQGAILQETNFSGAFTKNNTAQYGSIRIDLGFSYVIEVDIDFAINQLKARRNQKDDIKNAIFSGGVTKKLLSDFRKITKYTLKELKKIKNHDQNKINDFIQKMKEIEKILKDHDKNKKKTSYKFPKKYIKTIKKGIYPKAEADKIIAMLEKVKKTTETNN